MVQRLKQKEIAEYREDLLRSQSFYCTLCLRPIKEGQACLDHDHKTGYIRTVLCKPCNTADGKILGWAIRSGSYSPSDFLRKLLTYWGRDWSDMPLHPTHLTPNEKEIKVLKKRQRKLKTQKAIDRYELRIQALKAREDR